MFFLYNNSLISKHQSGFRPGDSTICQLISITSTMNHLNNMMKPEQYFLTYRKRLTRFGISDNLLSFFEDYLLNRNQRAILNGFESTWRETYAGVPQGSVLGPCYFLFI